MKVLAIDDQRLVLLPLQKGLVELGYDVKIETNSSRGIEVYDFFNPDLVIVDVNMPGVSGLGVVKYIRETKNATTPIMVLSGNTQDDIIIEGFELGINDYMKKPLSLREVCSRTKRLIGAPKKRKSKKNYDYVLIQKRCVGVVIPCYNEEKRLLNKKFTNFIKKNSGYHLCFVNDGSKDKTLEVLYKLRKGREDFITVYDCEKNGGKAEAVRLGILHMAKQDDLDYIGFLDADLSTNLADFEDLVSIIEKSNFKIVSGYRICRIGAKIKSRGARKMISLSLIQL